MTANAANTFIRIFVHSHIICRLALYFYGTVAGNKKTS